ncbi:MAG: CHAT domain-containing protein [Bacteroidota bacterium]
MVRATFRWVTFFFLLCYSSVCFAQSASADSIAIEKLVEKIKALENEGQLKATIPLYQEKQTIYTRQENWDNYITTFCDIALNYGFEDEYQRTKQYLDSAFLAIKKYQIDTFSNTYASVLSYAGWYYHEIGDQEKSLDVQQQTLRIDQQLYETNAPNFDSGYLASDYINIGSWYNERNDYSEAQQYFSKALSLLPEIDIRRAKSYNNNAFALRERRQFKAATAQYKAALNLLYQCPKSAAQKDALIDVYTNLADLYTNQERFDSAYFYMNQLKAITPVESANDLSDYYQHLGEIHFLEGRFELAKKEVQKALDIRSSLFDFHHPVRALSHFRLSRIAQKEQDEENALTHLQIALAILFPTFEYENYTDNPPVNSGIKDRFLALNVLRFKAQSLRKLQQPKAAKSTLHLAIRLIDQIRQNYLADGSKYALLERAMPIYEQAINLAVEMNELEWAMQVAEKSKATLLLENLRHSEAKLFAGIPKALLEQEREMKVQLAFRERLMNEAESEEAKVKHQSELFDLRQAYQDFLAKLEQQHPKYYELKYQSETLNVSNLQEEVLDDQTALLEYFVGDSSIYVFVLTQDDLQVQQLEKTANFDVQLKTLRQTLSQNSTNNFADFTSSSFFIYDHFLAKSLSKLPETINQFILIPDGQLSYIPFQALIQHPVNQSTITDPRFDTLSYLVYDYSISYAYSSTLLLKNQDIKKQRHLAFGGFAPVFEGGTDIPERSDRKQLGALPFSRMEVEQINALWRGESYLRNDASLANFKNRATHFDILHLSTHAAVADNPSQSRIYFYDDYLTVNEIYNLPIQADLTVLSACETGVGEYKKGEGLLSLARAFRYAGCPSLVTSLWQVNDEKTADLMLAFYENLQQKQSKSEALQTAQLDYLQTASMQTAHPFYWAAFVQVGERGMVVNDEKNWIFWVGGLTLLMTFIVGSVMMRKKKNTDTLF